MYDKLIQNYRVFFEGIPAPVFFKGFYPTGYEKGNREHERLHDYARGLKSDWPSDERSFAKYAEEYERDLRALFLCFVEDTVGLRRGVIVIPSSTKGEVNRVTELVRKILGSERASTISDLTQYFRRAQSKKKAHSGGTRSITENMDTLLVDPKGRVQDYDAILVLDDITTSGNSFIAADTRLREAGFRGQIVNFAFSRTCPSVGVDLFMRWEDEERLMDEAVLSAAKSPIDHPTEIEGIVFDLDDTLVCDTPRNKEYEEYLHGNEGQNALEGAAAPCPYTPFPGVRDFMSLGIPFAVVSNRSMWEVRRMFDDPIINDSIYPGRMEWERRALEEWHSSGERFYPLVLLRGSGSEKNQHENLFSYSSKWVDGYDKSASLYKPCPGGVLQAIHHLRSFDGLGPDARIVGVGNTPEDIIAYKAAGIDSVLALWGVPDYLRGHAKQHWGADYCFRSMAELGHWCGHDVPDIDVDAEWGVEDFYKSTTSGQRLSYWHSDGEPSMPSRESSEYEGYFNESLLPEGVIHWSEAESHTGEMVSIYGQVESTYFDWEDFERNIAAYQMGADPGPTFIEIGEKYPSKKLVKIVIWGRDRGKFREAPDVCFKGKTVIFAGKPYVHNGITTVQISDPESIHVVNPIADLHGDDRHLDDLADIDFGQMDEEDFLNDDEGYTHVHDDVDYGPISADFPLYGWHFDDDDGWLDFFPKK